MKRSVIRSMGVAALATAFVATAGVASAVPFVVDSNTSSLGIGLDAGFLGSGSGSATANGSADIDVAGGVLTPGSMAIGIDDIGPLLGNWTGSGLFGDVTVSNASGFITGTPVNEGDPGVYDLAGWVLTLDSGVVALAGTPVFTFTPEEPIELVLETTLSTYDDSGALATWSIPVSALVTFSTLGQTVTVTVTGTLNLVEVPEPGTLLLVGAGLAGLVATGRKRA